jgi:peptidyl-dipeptidase A
MAHEVGAARYNRREMRRAKLLGLSAAMWLLAGCGPSAPPAQRTEVQEFLRMYEELYQGLSTAAAEAQWKAATDLTGEHLGERIGAGRALAVFMGSRYVIENSRRFLREREMLTDAEFRQLDKILLNAAESPGTIPEVVRARIEAEVNYDRALDSADYCLERRGGQCLKPLTAAELEQRLRSSNDLGERRRLWEAAQQPGAGMRDQLDRVRTLRNRVAAELGYSSYFHLRVADYGMSVAEMMQLMDRTVAELEPLYLVLHRYASRRLSERYGQGVGEEIPVHWLGDRWGRQWWGLSEGPNPDAAFKNRSPQWVVEQAARLYASLGWPGLPRSFWERSDLYALPSGSPRKKHAGAFCRTIDRDQDIRCLMNVTASREWFRVSHRELAGAYYHLAYSDPRVPAVLREGASRAFYLAVGELFGAAAGQEPYLRQLGLLPPGSEVGQGQRLLQEALEGDVVAMPWYAGVLSRFEYELYEQKLPAERFNRRWWELAARYQRIRPPEARGGDQCDPCGLAEMAEAPAQAYDYAIAQLIKHQLHDYIARNLLKQSPWQCNYYGSREVGRWLWEILSQGATRDWRQLLREKTGEDLSSRAMLAYYEPLRAYLEQAGAGK